MTDHLADLLLAPSRDALENLSQEGIPAERVQFVGNVMIDALTVPIRPSSNDGTDSRPNVSRLCYVTALGSTEFAPNSICIAEQHLY